MKTVVPTLVLAGVLAGCSAPSPEPAAGAAGGGDWIQLFNGQDLAGWDVYLGPKLDAQGEKMPGTATGLNSDPDGVFTVVQHDGGPVIRVSGVIGGGFSTVESFENYHLRLQMKWGEGNPWNRERADSGLLYHAGGEHGVDADYWLRSLEYQVMPDSHGDLITIAGCVADVTTAPREGGGRPLYDPNGQLHTYSRVTEVTSNGGGVSRLPSFKDPAIDWHTLELYTVGDTAVHVVDGQVVLIAYNTRLHENGQTRPLTSGKIQFQSEGSEVFYRNLELRTITAFPEGLVPPKPTMAPM
jgi:hypothetical protein